MLSLSSQVKAMPQVLVSPKLFSIFLIVILGVFQFGQISETAPNYSFVEESTSAPPVSYYDYIIVGGGTAGCPLAATLSESANVLVLERGGSPYVKPTTKTDQVNFLTTVLDASPDSFAQPFISEDGVLNHRARVLGGGSVFNAGFYSHAETEFVKEAGLDESLVNDSYRWVEKKLVFEPPVLQWQSAVRDGLLEAGVLPYNGFTYDHIYGTKIATGSRPKAEGVIFEDAKGIKHKALLKDSKSEIIVAAGAMGSPQLLMLSGVGPANQLEPLGIDVVIDQPMVGQGMADNPLNGLIIPSPLPVEISLVSLVGITQSGNYIEAGSGLNLAPSWIGWISNNLANFLNQTIKFNNIGSILNTRLKGGIIIEKVKGPISTGNIELKSTNPNDTPRVKFNYFQAPEDLRKCVQGMETVINIVNSKAFSKFRYEIMSTQDLLNLVAALPLNLRPRHLNTAISLEQFCIDTVMTLWHYHGGCQIGKVVDQNYRVLGVDGLRVIDGSTFNFSPGTNPQATVMMLGSFVEESIFAPEISHFDYIIVGGGTAGCPLAATLSETVNVLVLERGGSPYDNPNKADKENILINLLDIFPNSYTEIFISEDGVINHRARVLGGGSVINAGFYSHADTDFLKKSGFDDLALVNDSYRWVEKEVVFKPDMLQWQTAIKDGLLEAKVLPFNGFTFDHINGTKIGGTIFDDDGHRHTAADLLKYAKPNNIKVYLHASVSEILFTTQANGSRPKAKGVVFEDVLGFKHKALLTLDSKGELILAAGCIGSPQLLMLSGIGPAHQLESLGIKTGAKVASNLTTLRAPGGLILEKFKDPKSKGHLELRSTNPKDSPKIRFNYFKDPNDIKNCVEGMETLMKTVDSKAFSKFRYEAITAKENLKLMTLLPINLRPRHDNTSTSLEQYCIDTVLTIWHYHGGCEVGKVVDKNYRVRGVDSLRVIDAGLDYSFVEESIFAPQISYFDYIIVGGGTAGCPLAATLSETVNVLVLERGGSPYDDPNKSDKANILVNLFDILPNSYTEIFITEDGVINHRARVLGGGSVINAGFYSHAEPEFLNKSGFNDLALVNDSYRWVEKKLVFKPEMLQWQTAFKDGLLEAKVLPFNGYTFDHINGTKISGTIFDEDGHRHSAADLLEYAKPDNIKVYLHATVSEILFTEQGNGSRPKAKGVVFEDLLGFKHKALLTLGSKGEVILAAGTIGSPQLLMLSGIGPAHQLGPLGIEMIMDQPMVGQEITDNPSNGLFVFSPSAVEVSSVSAVGITKTNNFIESISGVNLLPSWSQWISDNLLPILNQTGAKVNDAPNRTTSRVPGGMILAKVRFPMSKGHLELRSTNPKDTPKVRFNYFKDPKDIKTCVQGMETLMKTVDSKAFSKFRYEAITAKENLKIMAMLPVNLRPKHNNTATSLEQYCIDTVVTEWHYHGGCELGKVVDKNYRVRGVDSLRVLDASTFKSSPGTNPQATLMMLGRYIGVKIQKDRQARKRK
ncbi:hypothetical protein COLO4_14241 [Corchorus olitorius]|uniref:Glucose-methanol-choline oxidoreductase N-terminal domain-containing protein n=1 Tax=Corchorus olitorius TaxID=93759 RepID=A0A1R3JTD1_9ROSI|nr:hypothetical protein COLO4_14241 [Corchorus olitorius]